ncbi:MAG: 16S rRNA (cytosine(1402)-N(4))-methyltransferase RsmH [Desulfobulbaceae bacterium]|jgi:16S rRNA (cytosine1402-N4)-methyltransferase|nr:16S rRNA (cytosine(1402)-N(4))-methyltransferase RsmH [Desulfobulbaceae bacterium]
MTTGAEAVHTPVLLAEVMTALEPKPGGVYVDATLGLGGHSEEILRRSSPTGRLIGFEWDEEALRLAQERLAPFGERVTTLRRNFAEMADTLAGLGVAQVDGILIDAGMSSLQLDRGGRGFSFQKDEPLDMRMDSRRGQTAAALLATASEEELADIFFYYGEEKQARRIARAIAEARIKSPLQTSRELAELVARAIPRRFHPPKIHVATKTCQALRIVINGELENLARLLADAPALLNQNGKLAVISFHSLEDGLVKRAFRAGHGLSEKTKHPICAGDEEIGRNPRARSARLRVAEKTEKRGEDHEKLPL